MSNSLQPHELQHVRLPRSHQPLELAQRHVHWVGDAIQSSHPLMSPSSPAFNLFQQYDLFQWVISLHQVTKYSSFRFVETVSASASVLPTNIQDWFLLGLTGWISFQSKGLSRVFSNTQFKSIIQREWWWTGKPGVLQSMGLQRVRNNCVTELNWRD